MKKVALVMVFFALYFQGYTQVFNANDSLYYTDSSFFTTYTGQMMGFNPETGKVVRITFYTKGVRNGELLEYHPNGQLAKKVYYINGLPHGEVMLYHLNGEVQGKATYTNGLLDGEWQQFYDTGTIRGKGKYLKGKIHGESLWYDPLGKVSNYYAIPLNW